MALVVGALVASCDTAPIAPPPATGKQSTEYDPARAHVARIQTADVDAPVTITSAPVPGPGQTQLVFNGSFELNGGANTKAFTGWTNFSGSEAGGDPNGFLVQTGTQSPAQSGVNPVLFPVPAPPAGSFAAMSTQRGPGRHVISQLITLPPNGNGQLSFRLFIGNHGASNVSPASLLHGAGFENQQFRMDITTPTAAVTDVGSGVLLNVYQTPAGGAPIIFTGGYITVTADLSAFNGQTVRLRFAETDNIGFYNAGIDDVSVIANVNAAPAFQNGTPTDGATINVALGGTASFHILGDDPDAGQATEVVALGVLAGASLTNMGPSDPLDATFTWTPTSVADLGSHVVKFKLKDAFGGFSAERSVTIVVTNAAPAFQTGTPDDASVINAIVGNPVQFHILADDPDAGQAVTVAATVIPSGASLANVGPADPVDATFSWTPAAADIGSHTVTFKATDPYGAGTAPRSVTINVSNAAPVFQNGTPADGAVFIVNFNVNVQFHILADDPDAGQTSQIVVSGKPAGATMTGAGPADPVDATFSWTPTAADAGTHVITFQAKDPFGGASAVRSVTVFVNSPPAFLGATPGDGDVLSVPIGVNLQFHILADDPDAGQTSQIFASGVPAGASLTGTGPADPVDATFSWTPTDADVGNKTITFEAKDIHGATTGQRSITVTVVNLAPTFVGGTPANGALFIVKSGDNVQFHIQSDDPNPGQPVQVTATVLPTGATLSNAGPADPADATVSWTPPASAAGTHSVTFEAKDALGATTGTRTVTISVVGVITVNVRQLNLPLPNGIAGMLIGVRRTSDGAKYLAMSDGSGNATFGGLDNGRYCVFAKPLSSEADATVNGSNVVPPPSDFHPGTPVNYDAALSGPNNSTLEFNVPNYVANCRNNNGPVEIDNSNEFVGLDVSPSAVSVVSFRDMNGQCLPVGGWVVLDASGNGLPVPADLAADGVKAGLLVSGAKPNANCETKIPVPQESYVVESDIADGGDGQGQLTFTIKDETPPVPGQTENVGIIVLEPVLCVLNKHTEPAGDGNKIDFLGPVKDGFRASYTAGKLLRRNEAAIFYHQRGTGGSSVDFRVNVNGKQLNLDVDYDWNGNTGALTRQRGAAYDAGVRAQAFFAKESDGSVRVSWTITGFPTGMTEVSYRVKTTGGDKFPNAPQGQKPDQDGPFKIIPMPNNCTGGQSNDDRWWIE